MQYCNLEEKSTINLKFGDGYADQWEMIGPVTITTVDGALVFRANGGNLCRYTPENWAEVLFPLQFPVPQLLEVPHPTPNFCQAVSNPVPWVNYQIPDLGFNAVAQSPGAGFQPGSGSLTVRLCKITITDGRGATFEKEGACPLTFTVSCGDECPPGYCKCKILKYPGFCCCKCSKAH